MKQRILFLIAALTVFGLVANAQTGQDEGVSFGLRGGVNFQNINGKDMDDDKLEMDMVVRFNAGAVVEIPVAPEFYFQSGLLFTTKGAKSDELLGTNSNAEYNISYLELPLHFLYKPLLGTGHFLLGFGPYISYGLGGKATLDTPLGDEERDIEFTDEYTGVLPYDQHIKRMDFGADLFFGYQLQNGFLVQLNTQLGLAKINPDNTTFPDADTSFKNTGFGISVGYMF